MRAPPGSDERTGRGSIVGGLAALVVLVALLVGVPVLLALGVGNPWPGSDRIELADTASIALGGAAAVAWVVWARFAVAVLVEVPTQWGQAVAQRARPAGAPPVLAVPGRNRRGVGLVAARLVAAVLVLLPLGMRAAPAVAVPPSLIRTAPVVAVVPPSSADRDAVAEPGASLPTGATVSVVVAEGDTLRGLARRHLGDADRWREIFELNRERPQPDRGQLASPSIIHVGWSLALPAGATVAPAPAPAPASAPATPPAPAAAPPPAVPPWPTVEGERTAPPRPFVGPSIVTVAEGDTLWDLTRARLAEAGHPHDDHHILIELGDVVAANPSVQDDPDLIHPGERIILPAIGTAPPVPTVPAPPPPTTAAPMPPPRSAAEPSPPVAPPPPDVAASSGPSTTAVEDEPRPDSTSVTDSTDVPPVDGRVGDDVPAEPPSPSPVGLGEAALLSTGVLAVLAARRRRRLRSAEPRARLPEPPSPDEVATERRLRAVDARERLVRVDIAVRAAASTLVDGIAQPAVVRVATDGSVELTLTADAVLPPPWQPATGRWVLPGAVPIELLAEAARRVGAPCVALTQLGVDEDGREVLVDLEALGVLGIEGPEDAVESVVRGVAATLASSIFAEPANLVGVGLDELVFLGHRLSHHVGGVESAVELATTLVGATASTASARQSTFVLRARHTSGESWEPAVIVVGPGMAHEVTPELVRAIERRRGGLALVVGGPTPEGAWTLVADGSSWRLDPLGLRVTPVGLTGDELAAVYDVLHAAEAPLLTDAGPLVTADVDPPAGRGADDSMPAWCLLVRLLGEVDVVDAAGRPVRFERSKTLELIAWLTEHRDRSTRAGARSALWELDVRDATFANVVSEARRSLARHVAPPEGEEWLERTLTERLPLHELLVSDADLVRRALDHARLAPPLEAIDILRPAVELIRGVPFAGTGYLWPDPEGITSNLVLLATSAATELAGHYLSVGDVDGVFWATGRGLQVLPGHEELIALRMRAHHRAGDLAGVRQEWESYERVLDADAWGDGEPAPKLVELRRELLSSAAADR